MFEDAGGSHPVMTAAIYDFNLPRMKCLVG